MISKEPTSASSPAYSVNTKRVRIIKYLGLVAAFAGACVSALNGDFLAAASVIGAALSSANIAEAG